MSILKPNEREFWERNYKIKKEPRAIDMWKAGVFAICAFWIGFFLGNCVGWM